MARVRARIAQGAVLSLAALNCNVPDRHVQVDRTGSAGVAGVSVSNSQRTSGGNAGAATSGPTSRAGAGGSAAGANLGGASTEPSTQIGGATAQFGGSTGLTNGGTAPTATTLGSGLGGSASGGAATGGVTTSSPTTGGVAAGSPGTGGVATGGAATGGATTTTTTTTTTGGAAAWCATQTIPTGVAAADYQCVDFDNGLPPVATWPRTLTNSGTMQLTTARAASAPNSLVVTVPGADTFQTQATATATWNVTGADPITRVSLWASLSPPQIAGPTPDWTGYVSLLCASFGYGEACLLYTRGADVIDPSVAYTGYFLSLMYSGGPAYLNFCAVPSTGKMTPNTWTKVELRITKGSPSTVQVFFDGAEAVTCTSTFSDDTVAKFTFGEEASYVMPGWTMHYDNIAAAVYR